MNIQIGDWILLTTHLICAHTRGWKDALGNPLNGLRVIPSWVASQPSQLRDRDAHVSGGEECNESSIFDAKLQLSTLAKTKAFA